MNDPNSRNQEIHEAPQTRYGRPADPRQAAMDEFVNYRFSPDELRVIKECEGEAMFKRCMPFSFILGLAALAGVKRGILKPNKTFGAAPKVIGSAFFGYVAGRYSYQSVCEQKLMNLSGSKFGEMLRKRKKYGQQSWPSSLPEADVAVTTAMSLAPLQTFSSDPPNSLDLDTTRPSYDNVNDTYRSPLTPEENNLDADLNIPAAKTPITYEELRRKNREKYAGRYPSTEPQSQPLPMQPQNAPIYNAPPERRLEENEPRSPQSKNKYGDMWSQ